MPYDFKAWIHLRYFVIPTEAKAESRDLDQEARKERSE